MSKLPERFSGLPDLEQGRVDLLDEFLTAKYGPDWRPSHVEAGLRIAGAITQAVGGDGGLRPKVEAGQEGLT